MLIELKKESISPSPSEIDIGNKFSKYFANSISEYDLLESNNKSLDTKENLRRKLEIANQHRVKGNMIFKKNKFKDASVEYLKAIDELNSLFEINKKCEILNVTNVNWVRVECLNNISLCFLLLKDYEKVIAYTNDVLIINEKNFIALSYRAKALISLNLFTEALEIVRKALTVKYSKSLMNMLKEIEDKINNEKTAEHMRRAEKLNESNTENKHLNAKNEINLVQKDDIFQILPPEENFQADTSHSPLKTIFKFVNVFSVGFLESLRKNKFLLLIIILIWIFIFRRRLTNKLLSLLRIKFN
jgi:tetratricopeptide (TPR) repeat protein